MARPTLNLLAATILGMIIVPFAVAQAPVSDERRRACEGQEGFERKRCESGDSSIGAGGSALGIEDAADDSRRLGEIESRQAQSAYDLSYLKAAAAILALASQSENLDLKEIGITTGEIRKRAKRLRSNLGLPSSGPRDAIRELELPADRPQLKLLIQTLAALITEAVRNPLPTGHVLDIIGSLKARSDLDAIVELSGRIREQCELFGKSEQ